MLSPEFFIKSLQDKDVNFYTGVPDSLLKSVCAYIADNVDEQHNIIAANEGAAIGLAAGYYLASGKIPLVYMQNSGEGNAINPLLSLTDKAVYNIPVLLLVGWRGEPGVKDEPQHIKQGEVTLSLLDTMGIEYSVLNENEHVCEQQLSDAIDFMIRTKESYALVVRKDTFATYKRQSDLCVDFEMSREEAIQLVAKSLDPTACVISTTGMISRELFEYRESMQEEHGRDFLTVGSMGHASQVALGVALTKPKRRVFCFDGDGATLMHMGSLAITASKHPKNYIHVIFNNGAHDSVGGQPTVGLDVNFTMIATAVGYNKVYRVTTRTELERTLTSLNKEDGPIFLEVCVKKGNRTNLGRPTTTPIQNKEAFMSFIQE